MIRAEEAKRITDSREIPGHLKFPKYEEIFELIKLKAEHAERVLYFDLKGDQIDETIDYFDNLGYDCDVNTWLLNHDDSVTLFIKW